MDIWPTVDQVKQRLT